MSTTTTTMVPSVANPTSTLSYRFIEKVEKFTIIDIDKLQAIAIDSEAEDTQRGASNPLFGTGRCTTALAGLCFSTVEQIGIILRTDLRTSNDIKDAIKGGNLKNAISFFDFFSLNGLQSVTPAEIEAVYYLFRNKITHNLFPKHGLGAAQNIANPLNQFVVSINGVYSLNVNFLADYIKNAVPIIKGLLGNPNNAGLIITVDNNLQGIQAEEEHLLRNKYHHIGNGHLQPYFSQWLPNITF